VKPAVDSSVAIAAFSSWHALHEPARQVVDDGASLPAHAGFETFSVLTRLPDPTRASPARVGQFLREAFGNEWLTLPGVSASELITELAERGLRGGATYDALIGATARAAGTTLYTCDLRARRTYELLGVEVVLVG
jgi:predicted nucleic acid-binding protein